MKLLPPKPPTSAGTAKSGKKKEKKEEASNGISLQDENNVNETNSKESNEMNGIANADMTGGSNQADEVHQESLDKADENLDVPSMAPIDDSLQNLDATIASMAGSASTPEKKKGLFAKLFSKKNKSEGKDMSLKNLPPPEGLPAENSAAQTGSENGFTDSDMSSSISTNDAVSNATKLGTENSKDLDQVTNDADIPKFDDEIKTNEEMGISSGESWDKQIDETQDIPNSAQNYVSKGKYDVMAKYSANKNSGSKRDYVNYDSMGSYKKTDVKSGAKQEHDAQKDWGSDSFDLSNKLEEKVETEGTKVKEIKETKETKKSGGKKNRNEKATKTETADKFIDEEKQIPESTAKKIKPETDFSVPVHDWREQSNAMAAKSKTDSKSVKILDAKLRKLLKSYDSKIIKFVAAGKKSILLELGKANKRIEELQKKEKTVFVKEQKLLHLGKSLSKEKAEFDSLVETEKELMKSKEILEADVLKSAKELAELKSELVKTKKEFNTDKKAILTEKIRLQTEFKDVKLLMENEKKKGERKLSELAKQVEQAQAELDETIKKGREASYKLRNKELLLQQREKEVTDLIEQEQKIVSILKSGADQGSFEHIVHQRKKKIPKPATMLDAQGEPQIYADDEDTLNKKINDCKDLLSEENFDDAKMLYNEIREDFLRADIDADRKKELNHEIRELYDEICLSLVSPKK